MKISIVTISFNQGKYLKECIDSVLMQDHSDFEYIVVDPGSTDGSQNIIKSYGNSIISIFEKDNGPSDGLNSGFSIATGDIYGFINSDDFLLPGSLSYVNKFFNDYPEIDVLCGNGYQINSNSEIIRKLYSTDFSAKKYAFNGVNIVQQSTFFRRRIFEKVFGFNVSNCLFWDGELFVRMSLAGAKFHKTSKFLGAFRLYPESSSGGMGDHAGYMKEDKKLKEEILQRNMRKSDFIIVFFYKTFKYICNPQYSFSALLWHLFNYKK